MERHERILRRPPYGGNPAVGPRARRTYDRILQAALVVFERLGFDEARMDDVAVAADTSRATVYQYFESKEEILEALSNRMAIELMALVADLDPLAPTATSLDGFSDWMVRLHDLNTRYRAVADSWIRISTQPNVLNDLSVQFVPRLARALGAKLPEPANREFSREVAALVILGLVTALGDRLPVHEGVGKSMDELLEELSIIVHTALFGESAVDRRARR